MEDERPIHPMKETDQNIDYISPDKLPILSEEQMSQENISINLTKMVENPKWKLTFDAMVYFRSINNQNSSLIKTILPELVKYFPKLSNSIRSGISKEAIILVGEILSNFIIDNIKDDLNIIKQLFYVLFQSASSNKKFIKDAAMELIDKGLIKNKKYYIMDIICLLLDLMKDKKSTVCDVCFNAYENMIQYINIKNGNINDDTWIFFFDKINELYAAKKEIYVKKCVKIIEFFENNLGKNKFEELLIKLNRKDDIKKYENWILLGSKKNTSQMSFKDFIKSKKNNKMIIDENK
jgi:hypothetical protein